MKKGHETEIKAYDTNRARAKKNRKSSKNYKEPNKPYVLLILKSENGKLPNNIYDRNDNVKMIFQFERKQKRFKIILGLYKELIYKSATIVKNRLVYDKAD